MNNKASIQQAFRDRNFLVPFIVTGVVLLILLVLCAVEIRPSELQVPIRNTVFGITYTYREQWYNELSFVGFVVLLGALHTFISLKLYSLKDVRYAVAFQWLTVVLLCIAFLMFVAIFRVISIVE